MLVTRQCVVTDDLLSLKVATAKEAARDISAPSAAIDCALRIGAKRTRAAGGRRRRTAAGKKRLRRYLVFDPIDQGTEGVHRARPCATSAMSHAGCAEQPVEVLQVGEIRLPAATVLRRHLPVVVDHPAWKDQLIIAANPGQQLAAVRLELIERRERVGDVRYVLRAVLRDLRVLLCRHRLPIEIEIVLIPMELGRTECEGVRSVKTREVGAAIESEPDFIA